MIFNKSLKYQIYLVAHENANNCHISLYLKATSQDKLHKVSVDSFCFRTNDHIF